ncbi:hypothetical protein ACQEVB_17370 [Pseudonocardia sp. CA-107938]|uniref:hypothetical protein n=1 Tax=Pseudonocardia sp. CA-107938 TaxID=3240021 RepID=UPI003D8CFB7E
MGDRFQVQARLMRRRNGTVVHDETRFVETGTVEDAQAVARRWTGEGLTTWVYALDRVAGRTVYRAIEDPAPGVGP